MDDRGRAHEELWEIVTYPELGNGLDYEDDV